MSLCRPVEGRAALLSLATAAALSGLPQLVLAAGDVADSGATSSWPQVPLSTVEQMPPEPTPLRLIDWRRKALALDTYLFESEHARQLGLYYEVDGQSVPAANWNGTSFGIPSYANDTRMHPGVHSEGLPVLGAVLGAAAVGRFNTTRAVQALSVYFVPARPTSWTHGSANYGVWSDSPFGSDGSSWYQLAPNVFALAAVDLYRTRGPGLTAEVEHQAVTAAERWVAMAEAVQYDFNHTSFDWPTMSAHDNGVWVEADGGAGVAWIALAGWSMTGQSRMLDAAVKSVLYLDNLDRNPLYEMLLPWGALAAARLVSAGKVSVNLQKLLNWCMTGDAWVRIGWGITTGVWGNASVDGLMGSQIDGAGYAFFANTVWTAAALLPVARHAPQFADAIAKWAVAATNNARLFYGDELDPERQSGEADFDPEHVVPYEGIRRCDFGRPQGRCLHGFHWGPFGTGQNCGDEGVHAGSGRCCPHPPCDGGQTDGTDVGIYGGTYVGLLGAIVSATDNAHVPRFDLTATDFFAGATFPTYMFRNPLPSPVTVSVSTDAARTRLVALYCASCRSPDGQGCPIDVIADRVAKGTNWSLTLPPRTTRVVVLVPSGAQLVRRAANGTVTCNGFSVCTPPRPQRAWGVHQQRHRQQQQQQQQLKEEEEEEEEQQQQQQPQPAQNSATSTAAADDEPSVGILRRFSYPPALYSQGCGTGGDPADATSDYANNFNAAAAVDDAGNPHLLVRVQDAGELPCGCGSNGRTADVMAHTRLADPTQPEWQPPRFTRITNASIVLRPSESCAAIDACGVQDPRVVSDGDGTFFVFYTAYGFVSGVKSARLAVATTRDLTDPAAYRKVGPVFPSIPWSKSAAVIRNAFGKGSSRGRTPHLMLWGDSGGGPVPTSMWGIRAAVAPSLQGPWVNINLSTSVTGLFLSPRPDAFDSELVESGPPPQRLSTGHWLFLYNSASKSPSYDAWKPYPLQYNVGWVILDADDPTKIVARSPEPLWSPSFWYETGGRRIGDNSSWAFYCAASKAGTPNVVFVEGMYPLSAPDTFRVVAAGADFVTTTVDVVVVPPGQPLR